MIAVMTRAWAAAVGVVTFAMVEAALAACGSGGRGQITRVLEPISRGECISIGEMYTRAIVVVRRGAVRKS